MAAGDRGSREDAGANLYANDKRKTVEEGQRVRGGAVERGRGGNGGRGNVARSRFVVNIVAVQQCLVLPVASRRARMVNSVVGRVNIAS